MFNKLNSRRGGFTLVEIMIVVAIIALLAAIAVPGFLRARKRAQASKILNDLRLIDAAVDQYAIETAKTTGATVNVTDWTNYLKKETTLFKTGTDMFGLGSREAVVAALSGRDQQAFGAPAAPDDLARALVDCGLRASVRQGRLVVAAEPDDLRVAVLAFAHAWQVALDESADSATVLVPLS